MTRKIVVTVTSPGGLNASLDPRFGRAGAFLIVDEESREIVSELPNDAANAARGAGTGAASIMSRNQVAVVISGAFGPKAYQALEALGIEMWIAPPGISASQALDDLAKGGLTRMEMKRY